MNVQKFNFSRNKLPQDDSKMPARRGIEFLYVLLIIPVAFMLYPNSVDAALQDDSCTMPFESVSRPLTDLGDDPYIRMDGTVTGFTGGLYPEGSNVRPMQHESAGQQVASRILPLNAAGEHDPLGGRIVLISIGMSNTGQEFGAFQRLVHRNPEVNPQLTLINGGVGGRTAEYWVDPESDAWDELQRRLDHFSVSNEQVQAAWVKLTLVKGGDFPDKAVELQEHLAQIMRHLKARFPNLKIAYLSSRTRSYTYWRGLSPEPLAFETGFAVRWLIEQQINGDPSLNYDPSAGEVLAPYLSWGPYLWADGLNPRADGLTWLAEDLTGDCTHPSESGKEKVADMLLDFFLNDSTARWFRSDYVPFASANTTAPRFTVTPASNAAPTNTQQPSTTPSPESPERSTPTALSQPSSTDQPAGRDSKPASQPAEPQLMPILGSLGLAAAAAAYLYMRSARKS